MLPDNFEYEKMSDIGEFFTLLDSITGLKLLITHNTDLKGRFANVITISKTDGISTISQ